MAMKKPAAAASALDDPVWPDTIPDTGLCVRYGVLADELVVRFSDRRYHDVVVVVPIATPDHDYAGLLVAADSGAVLGVHVYPLATFAVKRHPGWRPLREQEPPPAVVGSLIKDIRALYDRYGI
jgi:hypothetical protein